ncbi:MAG: hypothetical protein K9K64_13835 [Desulfohalobiaceae bacterium]|nr:hypothetical protein [Desulfohalobiaceae bacterium]
MARRATLFKSLREKSGSGGNDFLAVAGPYEFERIQRIRHPDPHYARLVRAMARLNYDLGMLCFAESETLKSLDIQPPANWFSVKDTPLSKTVRVRERAIGFVLMPDPQDETAWPAIRDKAAQEAKQIKDRVDLLFLISPWGKSREQEFLQTHPGTFDVLLGGGPGGGLRHKFSENRTTLWVRPYRKGKTVSKITVSGEGLRSESGWALEKNVWVESVSLSEDIEDDPEMTAIFQQ